jgi:hypothetical protein
LYGQLHICGLLPNPARVPNSKNHALTLSIGNFMLMMKKPKNLEFEPVHSKNVLLASVIHGISCLFFTDSDFSALSIDKFVLGDLFFV